MFGPVGVTELLIILVIIVILFGVNKLPRLGKGLGEGIRNFKDSIRSGQKGNTADNDNDAEGESVDPK